MVIKIPQEKYPIKPVREAFQREGFRYSKEQKKIRDSLKIIIKGHTGILKKC